MEGGGSEMEIEEGRGGREEWCEGQGEGGGGCVTWRGKKEIKRENYGHEWAREKDRKREREKERNKKK